LRSWPWKATVLNRLFAEKLAKKTNWMELILYRVSDRDNQLGGIVCIQKVAKITN
jgi:hypothetical protein